MTRQKVFLVLIVILVIALIVTYQRKNQNFTVSPISGKAPLTISTSNLEVCKFYKIEWGDQTMSTSYNAQKSCEYEKGLLETETHTYTLPGEYTVNAYYGKRLIGEVVVKVNE